MKTIPSRHSCRALSLVEILACMAILTILAAASLPMLSSVAHGNQMSQNLQTLGGTLEAARQAAIAKNTFVWVAFADVDPSIPESELAVALVASKTGDDSLGWSTASVDIAANGDVEFLDRVRELPGIRIRDVASVSGKPLEDIAWKIPQGGTPRTFSKAIQFTPTGEARVRNFTRLVQFEIFPVRGSDSNSAVVSIATITGKTKVARN